MMVGGRGGGFVLFGMGGVATYLGAIGAERGVGDGAPLLARRRGLHLRAAGCRGPCPAPPPPRGIGIWKGGGRRLGFWGSARRGVGRGRAHGRRRRG
jgi:hypothetical protein